MIRKLQWILEYLEKGKDNIRNPIRMLIINILDGK